MNGHHTPSQGAWPTPPDSGANPPPPQGGTPPPSGGALPWAPLSGPVAGPTQDERLMAAVSHGMSFVEGGIFAPLIIYFVKKDSSPFVAFHALQSLYFGLAFLVLSLVTCGFGAIILVWPYLIFEAIATVKSYEGEWYELPIVGRMARERHPG